MTVFTEPIFGTFFRAVKGRRHRPICESTTSEVVYHRSTGSYFHRDLLLLTDPDLSRQNLTQPRTCQFNLPTFIMSFEGYGQFPNAQQEGVPGQGPPPQDGAAPGQPNDPSGQQQMPFQAPNVSGTPQSGPGGEGKTTLWYVESQNHRTEVVKLT